MTGHDPLNPALFYDADGYEEKVRRSTRRTPGAAAGLMGRQVAGKEFLDAYLTYGSWDCLTAVVTRKERAEPLVQLCQTHPSSRSRRRRLRIIEESNFHTEFLPSPPAPVLHFPGPPEARFAWARQPGGSAEFALCGVTHTLCSVAASGQLCELVTAPFESFDALICTSRAVADMVRAVTGAYADHLRQRHGGTPTVKARLETIPLGVNVDHFRPATPEERVLERRVLGVTDDEVAVLFVGRLSHHAKAHPFPLFHGVSRAARQTGQKVHLLMAGWAVNAEVRRAFEGGARFFAPNVRVSLLDGTQPRVRVGAWRAADVFASLPDNIQETFGLVVVEAMASGLPVVASDWNGYRDLIVPGATGYLVPTLMVPGATIGTTSRLLFGTLDYDHFLAECSQAVVVDADAAAAALALLLADPNLRHTLGAAGRRRAVECFSWERVIRAYETLWREQDAERRDARERGAGTSKHGPARYPPPETSFAGYPTVWLADDVPLRTVAESFGWLEALLNLPLTNHVPASRCHDLSVLRALMTAATNGSSLGELVGRLTAQGVSAAAARATLAWMLKYRLLRPLPVER